MQDNAIIKVKRMKNDGGVNWYDYGTAYLINNTHAITALHVVEDCQSITFIFHDNIETTIFTIDYKNEYFDIALITFPPNVIESIPPICTIEIIKADTHDKWYGAGYPRYAEEGDCRKREELKGSCYRCPIDKNFFEISCDKQPILKEWGGVSGAPVFLENKLIGVISQFDKAIKNTHFSASAIWKLLATDEKFRVFFHGKDKEKKILKAAQSYLEDAENADLKKAIGGRANANNIVRELAAKELPEMLETLKELKTDTKKLAVFVMKLLPKYFIGQAIVIDFGAKNLLQQAIDIDCVSDVAAECSVAAFSGREANIECIAGSTPYDSKLFVPIGKYALSPECGIGNEKADIDALTSQILAGAALDEALFKRWGNIALNPELWINNILAKAKKEGNHFYLVVRLDSNRLDYKEKIDLLRKYKIKYPALLILNLSSNEETEGQEMVLHLELPAFIS